jgi:long-chain fatty acid transport protein
MGYTYDMDPSSDAYGTTMLPPGDRHIVGFGVGYKILDNLRLDLGYNFILMESSERMIHDETGKFSCDNSYSHIASFTISYSF